MILGYSDEVAHTACTVLYLENRGMEVAGEESHSADRHGVRWRWTSSWRFCGMLEIRALDLNGDTRRTLLPLDC